MAQALDASAYIFEGVWTNWTKGAVRGLTLTLRPANATLLTNTLALFVTMAGGQLWTITRFVLHQVRSARAEDSDYRKKHQIVLRNTTTDLGTAQFMVNLAWATRQRGTGSQSFAIVIATVAVLHALVFMAAGTFSNVIANAGTNVLSRSPHCGIWNDTYINIANSGPDLSTRETASLAMQYINKGTEDTQLALNYAQKCYLSGDGPVDPSCMTNKVSTLDFDAHNTSCPFALGMCTSEGVVFETAVIDSHHDLGINAPPEDRVTYQRRTTCAVLNGTGYISSRQAQPDNASPDNYDVDVNPQNISFAYYGQSLLEETPWTFDYIDLQPYYTNFTPQTTVAYQIAPQWHYAGEVISDDSASCFVPIPQLEQKSADLTILFLAFVGNYLNEVNDPWFSAHSRHQTKEPDGAATIQYAPDRKISPLACTEQHQFCTSTTCTPFLGVIQIDPPPASFAATLNPRQNVTRDRIFRAAARSSLGPVVDNLGMGNIPILAQLQTLTSAHTFSLGLPNNQWQLELNFWYTVAMSLFQQSFVQFNTGQIAAETKYFVPPESEAAAWWCKNLMIPSTMYQSFSVLTLLLIFVFGLLIILSSLMIETLAGWVQGRSNQRVVALRESWDNDDMLILQERAKRDGLWKPVPPPKDPESISHRRGSDDSTGDVAAPPPYRTKRDFREQDMRDVEKFEGHTVQTWI